MPGRTSNGSGVSAVKQRAKYKNHRLNIIGRESMVKAESERKMGLKKSVVL